MGLETKQSYSNLLDRLEELEKQGHLLRLISDNSPAYTAYVGADDLRYRFVNQKYVDDFKQPREQIIGKHIKEIIGEKNYEFALPFIAEAKGGNFVSYENVFDIEEGKRWIKVNFSPDVNDQGEVLGIVVLSFDITELKQAEELLQKSESLYHDLVETSQDLIWQCDAEGRYIYLNPAWEAIFGYKTKEMLGKKFTEFQSPEFAEKDYREFMRLRQGNTVKGFETVHLGRDGREIHLVFNAKFITDDNGNITGTRGTAYDITERYQALKQLKEKEQTYRELVENTEDLITHADKEGRFKFVNHTSKKIFGISPEDCVGLLAYDFIHPEDQERTQDWFMECVANKKSKASIENRQVNQITNNTHTLLWSSSFAYDDSGSLIGVGGIARDVTPIRTAEQNYANLFEKMLDGFALHEIICDDEGVPVDYRFLNVNPAFENLTGLKGKDLVDQTVLSVMPGTEKHWIDTYGRVALSGEPISFENYSVELNKHFEVTAYRPAKNQFACIFQDITPRKKAEEEKAVLETQLRHTQKMEAIGTLSGGIAHDFNNILAAILGFAEMAQDDIPDWNPAKQQIEEVVKAGNRAKDLVKQILAFSRKAEHSRIPIQIPALIKETLNFLRASIPTTIDIQLDINPQCGNILADPTQIHQVLMNLCTNAAQSMEDSGGVLCISLSPIDLTDNDLGDDSSQRPGPYVVLSVKDSGVGVKEEDLDRIFDPYFTTKDFGKGSGMGLAVVHGIVLSHEGQITVESNPGQGTTFKLFFPRLEGEVEVDAVDTSPLPLGNEKILIVDDDASIANLTRRRLEKLGYQTTAETSSLETLELFRAAPDNYDLVITDQTMPDMTGDNLAREVLKIRPDIPIIMCTGYSSKIDAEKAKHIGVSAFIMKPVDNKALARTVRQVLDSL